MNSIAGGVVVLVASEGTFNFITKSHGCLKNASTRGFKEEQGSAKIFNSSKMELE